MTPIPHKLKAYGYIVQAGRILLMEHTEAPNAGLQIPGGTVDAGESPEAAALRECREETGLWGIAIVGYLGLYQRVKADWGRLEHHTCHVYQMHLTEPCPPRWFHLERGRFFPRDSMAYCAEDAPLFELFWADITTCPPLMGNQDALLPELRRRLGV